MKAFVDLNKAEQVFREAVKKITEHNYEPTTNLSPLIEQIILGPHLTYRYMLTTALLSKATCIECNPLALQAKSTLDGAFDARSVCHSVLVPLERELLGDRLGGSNEPYLNKPARYTEISETNAARRGRDTELRDIVINVCKEAHRSQYPFALLLDCTYWIFQRASRNIDDYVNFDNSAFKISSVISFASEFLSQSHEGETCSLLAGTSFSLLAEIKGMDLDVRTHKSNQAGSSSKEVSDIDVYLNEKLAYTAEVKDKQFSVQDVEHAVKKVAASGGSNLLFLTGPRSSLTNGDKDQLVIHWNSKGFNLSFINVLDFFNTTIFIHNNFYLQSFISMLNYHAENAKIKDMTFKHLTSCLQNQGW